MAEFESRVPQFEERDFCNPIADKIHAAFPGAVVLGGHQRKAAMVESKEPPKWGWNDILLHGPKNA